MTLKPEPQTHVRQLASSRVDLSERRGSFGWRSFLEKHQLFANIDRLGVLGTRDFHALDIVDRSHGHGFLEKM